ncbi:uncharacterized protein LOC115921856 [Strongylocentrotus purpuratus]|uniref:Reverse transcriptase n=1 Tax=Strongylocentrotus purpuratus TaxID=7668 RepID=A0A7M7NJZ9_STRPU|nr:uncharacterized protein LOC115921856 [Strongylocentrotus purpuratus]
MASEFSLGEFVRDPSAERLSSLTKVELLDVAAHYEVVGIKRYMLKSDILNRIVEFLVSEEVLSSEAADGISATPPGSRSRSPELNSQARSSVSDEVRIKELELERARVELEREKLVALNRKESRNADRHFDVAKHVRMVPPFEEEGVEKYFPHFEKLAQSMGWPREMWAHLIQSKFSGKARDAYLAMTMADVSDYDKVKLSVLKAYELVPEAYRQRFRKARKEESQTHMEFSRQKEQLFDRWSSSLHIDHDYDKLREILLLEEFKRSVRLDVRIHLEEQRVDSLDEAARIADDYVLTHKISHKVSVEPKKNGNWSKSQKTSSSQEKDEIKPQSQQGQVTGERMCYACRQYGHIKSKCPSLQAKKQKSSAHPNAFVQTKSNSQSRIVPANMEKIQKEYEPFVSVGYVSVAESDVARKVKVLRDTGASQSLILESALPFCDSSSVGASVLLKGIGDGFVEAPLHVVDLKSDLVSGMVKMAVRPSLPVEEVSIILGNDLAGDRVVSCPVVSSSPCESSETDELVAEFPVVFPACAVTRSMAKKVESEKTSNDVDVDLGDSFFCRLVEDESDSNVDESARKDRSVGNSETSEPLSLKKSKLLKEQQTDPQLISLNERAVSEEEALTVPVCYYKKAGVLMRKWRPADVPADEVWKEVHQIVVPSTYRQDIMSLAHEAPLAGHLGVHKTQEKILSHFFWPGVQKDVANFCRSCHACQVVGKLNQKIPAAPLKPIPAFDEPFSRIIVDCVGPLPKTKAGNEYLLTIMCAATRYTEAIPLRRITANNVTKALVKFFTTVGLPKTVQSDQGSNFMSRVFNQVLKELGVKHVVSSAYHPESQGALERFHQTLKNMLKTYCMESEKQWDEGVPLLLFAVRDAVQESLGFSSFELVYGHSVRGPLKLLKERLLCDDSQTNVLEYVSTFRERMHKAWEVARQNLSDSQEKMKSWYDRKSKERNFEVGARFSGPYTIAKRVGDVDYVVNTPDRQKKRRVCHVNMLKPYIRRNDESKAQPVLSAVECDSKCEVEKEVCKIERENPCVKLKNSEVLAHIDNKLTHLSVKERSDVKELLSEYPQLFADVPSRTDVVEHDVDVGDTTPIKQAPYRANPTKLKNLEKEIEYMLQNGIVEPSSSAWSSPCILVPKPDKSNRFCTDYRKVNACTKTDSFPIPRIDDCIDRIGKAKYVSKFDLLKGYWQIPLTKRAQEISAFSTPQGLFQYTVMPFGMKNAPATFQRLVNNLVANMAGCEAYIDDIIVYSEEWDEHVQRIRELFERLSIAKMTVNLAKSEFAGATVLFLGHVVGSGHVRPISAKVDSILAFPIPTNRKELMRFLGMAGYYRRFCHNFSDVVTPLTNLLRKQVTFVWSDDCESAFNQAKALLSTNPVLMAPDFNQPFSMMVDASDVGAGAVLTQADAEGIDRPISFFSKKFSASQKNYSTVEKETLALILALEHFDVYVSGSQHPVRVLTDHNPLTFLNRMKNKNQRLTRWSLLLQEYNLDILHVPGKDNVIADALSRV